MVNVAILGCGTVGSGVADVFALNAQTIAAKAGEDIRVKYILDVRDLSGTPYESVHVTDFSVIEADPEVSVVAEVIGGARVAYEFTKRALCAGKSVVTSNKELVATHGLELMALAREHGVSYLFEASVGGGIPLLHPISRCLTANDLTSVCGILNGTTNYILTKMIKEGISFKMALKQACDNGYAELDPTDDIEGKDACRKICILASLLSGRHIGAQGIKTEGITKVTLSDVRFADSADHRIKLLGRALRSSDGSWSAWVGPHLVPDTSPLATVDDVFNGVLVSGNAVDDVMFYGRGAGKMATASAVAADIIDIVASRPRVFNDFWYESGEHLLADSGLVSSKWYVRTDDAALAAKLSGCADELDNPEHSENERAFITVQCYDESGIKAILGSTSPLSLMRVL
ncbi:MAG: homoserine dehydrogenase [Oscillospiraceae bacterium]|nr:homoserine dehydrogenase [Oscillospiraceae bacterium]